MRRALKTFLSSFPRTLVLSVVLMINRTAAQSNNIWYMAGHTASAGHTWAE